MPDTKLPSDSPSEPSASAAPARLKDRVPPKPPRRGTAIPRSLVVSTMAMKIAPAPRPPIPQASPGVSESLPGSHLKVPSAQNWALDPHGERQTTMGPVAAPVLLPRARQQGVTSALIGIVAVGVLASSSWFLYERSSERQSASSGVGETVNANAARPTAATKAAPATGAIRTLDLDQDSGTASTAAAAAAEAVAKTALPSTSLPSSAKAPKLEPLAQAAGVNAATEPPKNTAPEAPSTPSADASAANDAETTTTVTEAAVPTALPPFDAQAAKSALAAGALSASSCRKGDDPRGTAIVVVTFAPSGRITSATVNGAPYGGTATGGCVAATLRSMTVPPFAGNHVTVSKRVTIR